MHLTFYDQRLVKTLKMKLIKIQAVPIIIQFAFAFFQNQHFICATNCLPHPSISYTLRNWPGTTNWSIHPAKAYKPLPQQIT